MSYDLTSQRYARRAAADFRASVAAVVKPRPSGSAVSQSQLREAQEDRRRLAFLKRLDEAEFQVTNWEADFIESQLRREFALRESGAPLQFSSRERLKIDQMERAYGHRFGEVQRKVFPAAVPGQCAYMVRDGETRELVRCGKPKAYVTPGGMEICEQHHQARVEWKRKQKEARR